MVAGDEIVGSLRFVYESPTGARSPPAAEGSTKVYQNTDRHDQFRIYPGALVMNENGFLVLQHKGGTGSQVHDSSAMALVSIPITYFEKSRPSVPLEKTLTAASRDTTRLADDVGDDATNFVDIMVWNVTAGQIWVLGSAQNPETLITTESTA